MNRHMGATIRVLVPFLAVLGLLGPDLAFAQGGVLLYTRQPTSEPPYKQIHRMNADGTGDASLTSLANGLNYPDWSPDALRIAACRYVSSTAWSIYSLNADGGGLTRLTDTPNVLDCEPDWSPDGARIVFTRMNASYENEQLWLMNADGSDLRALGRAGSAPHWSPDGSRLVYHACRGGSYGVYVCDADGANEAALLVSGGNEMLPAWSPDGRRIAFVSDRDGNPEIYVMNADASDQVRLTNNTARDYDPAWSPDGSLIAFESDASGSLDHWEIYLLRADGTNLRRLTHLASNVTAICPDWMPQDLRYLGRPRPGLTPVRFAPDSLCATADWFWHGSPVFSPDLGEVHWARYAMYPAYHRTELVHMRLDENRWSPAQAPPFADPGYSESNPCFGTSHDTLYFYSERPAGPRLRVTRTASGWSAPVPTTVPGVAGAVAGGQFSLARDGTLYFELWTGPQCDLYRSRRVGDVYQAPEPLAALNTAAYEFCPYVDPDERFILFDSNRPGGFGLNDLYISIRNRDGTWGEPRNLGPTVNSSTEDVHPWISPDGLYLFYVTERAGDLGFNPYWLDAQFIDDLLPDPATPTALQRWSATWRGDGIEVAWTLAQLDPGASFTLWREEASRPGFRALAEADPEQHDLSFTFLDTDVEPGRSYRYLVRCQDSLGERILCETPAVAVPLRALALRQNSPNPFNPATVISYDLPAAGEATLAVYDHRGRRVRLLAQGAAAAGPHEVVWDGRDDRGQPVSSGVYCCRLTGGLLAASRKMVLLR